MISLNFRTQCPHCKKEETNELGTDQPFGDDLWKCPWCDSLYVVSWSLSAVGTVARVLEVEKGVPSAKCTIIVEEWTDDDPLEGLPLEHASSVDIPCENSVDNRTLSTVKDRK